jgi:hypothetical protein
MASMSGRETSWLVLLGAGASRPAGVPTAFEMTHEMIRTCEAGGQKPYSRALKAISGGLQMGFGQSELVAIGSADVEQVLNAASLLGDRFNLELAPFVAAWHPIIEDLERRSLGRLDAQSIASGAMSRLGSAISETQLRSDIQRLLQQTVTQIGDHLSRHPDGSLFRELTAYLTGALIEITWLRSPEKLEYLDPLLTAARDARITVATLNYDNAVELRAKALGIPCETGLAIWSTTGELPRPESGIDLLKLHGSVKWQWSSRQDKLGLHYRNLNELNDTERPKSAGFNRRYTGDQGNLLGVIFGGNNKLTAEGPFLDLLTKFKRELEEHSRLLVVGYSFRDPHVNHYISTWLHKGTSRLVTIIDPYPSPQLRPRLRAAAGPDASERIALDPIGAEAGFVKYFGNSE